MIEYVIKRDGSTEPFAEEKIVTAVQKAMASIKIRSKNLPYEVTEEAVIRLKDSERVIDVDVVHCLVEDVVMDLSLIHI